jgi:hypothetical protein
MKEYNGIINISEPDNDYSIYKIHSSDPRDLSIYIGVSSNCKLRVYKHSQQRQYKLYKNKPLYIWMNNLIENKTGGKVIFEIISDNLSEEEAFNLEIKYIKEYKEKGYTILNISEGGKGNKGYIPWNKGTKGIYTETHISRLSESHKGNSGGMLAKNHSNNTKELLSLRNKQRTERNWSNPRKKLVYKYDEQGTLLKVYSCLRQASLEENVSPTSIGEWCRKVKVPRNRFTWTYTKLD